MITIETADKALKSFYLDAIVDALDVKANPFFAQLEKTANDVVGKDVRRTVRFGVNGGVNAGTETGDLPKAQSSNYKQFVAPLKNLYGTIEISDKAIKASANSEGAFVNLLNEEMDSLVKSASINFSRMLFGDGTGCLGSVKAVDGNTLTLDSVRNMMEGMAVEVYSATGSYNQDLGVRKVLKVNRGNKTIVLSGAPLQDSGVKATDELFVQGSRGNELTGFKAIFANSSNTLYGVEKEESEFMQPFQEVVNGEVTADIIQKAIDDIEESTGSKINFILCSLGVKRAISSYYRNYQSPIGRIAINGGFDAMDFNGIPVIADRFCPEGTMYLLNTNDFKIHQLCDWQWLEGEDGKVLKQIANKPVFTATLVKYAELICDRPGGQGILTGIDEM